jgi:hypothetical protein
MKLKAIASSVIGSHPHLQINNCNQSSTIKHCPTRDLQFTTKPPWRAQCLQLLPLQFSSQTTLITITITELIQLSPCSIKAVNQSVPSWQLTPIHITIITINPAMNTNCCNLRREFLQP